jgi:hypothetical protein
MDLVRPDRLELVQITCGRVPGSAARAMADVCVFYPLGNEHALGAEPGRAWGGFPVTHNLAKFLLVLLPFTIISCSRFT